MIVFVFGSNLAGRHGAGSAKEALLHYGAVYGQGIGLHGNSYAIPTKDSKLSVLSLPMIKAYINEFVEFAELHLDWTFNIVSIGCGLAGYQFKHIAPLFKNAPSNCKFIDKEFDKLVKEPSQISQNSSQTETGNLLPVSSLPPNPEFLPDSHNNP